MPRLHIFLFLLFLAGGAQAQLLPDSLPPSDTGRAVRLPEASVVGYGQQLPLRRTAAAVGVVDAGVLERFPQTALTQAVNTLPGVRLEERATGSYRLSIRGSTLRSPYGVRNVKVYYHDLPFTDPGGQTSLNLLDPGQIGRIEVLKGPAASVYGAGTGGVARFENRRPAPGQTQAEAGATAGSYGLLRYTAAMGMAKESSFVQARYAHQQQTGYREHSSLKRDVLALDGQVALTDRQSLTLHGLYTDLYYQLPGGLTRAEFGADPRQARPTTAKGPGSVAQNAFYASKTVLICGTHTYRLLDNLSLKTSLYGSASIVNTPAIANTEHNTILSGGGRAVLSWQTRLAGRSLRLAGGAEGQQGFTDAGTYVNAAGALGALQYQDEIRTATGFIFVQVDYELPARFLLTAGASYNRLRYQVSRVSGAAVSPGRYQIQRDFRPQVLPRLALLRELGSHLSAYASVSTGYSTPTNDEIRASDGSVNTALQPERGTSYELGLRGAAWRQRFTFEAALYRFRLRDAITTYTNAQSTTLSRNAGDTRQLGVELAAGVWLWQGKAVSKTGPADGLRLWASYAYNRYRFGNYVSAGNDNSGHPLTGTAPHTLTAGADLNVAGFYLNPTFNYQANIPLNDAGTEYAAAYTTLGTRLGYRRSLKAYRLDIFAGGENLTDRHYSLGNDLNAFGGRYFQPASGRSWYAGLSVGFRK